MRRTHRKLGGCWAFSVGNLLAIWCFSCLLCLIAFCGNLVVSFIVFCFKLSCYVVHVLLGGFGDIENAMLARWCSCLSFFFSSTGVGHVKGSLGLSPEKCWNPLEDQLPGVFLPNDKPSLQAHETKAAQAASRPEGSSEWAPRDKARCGSGVGCSQSRKENHEKLGGLSLS